MPIVFWDDDRAVRKPGGPALHPQAAIKVHVKKSVRYGPFKKIQAYIATQNLIMLSHFWHRAPIVVVLRVPSHTGSSLGRRGQLVSYTPSARSLVSGFVATKRSNIFK